MEITRKVEPRRQRKRWWAAALLWLVVAYSLSIGPVFYCHTRGWLRDPFRSAAIWLYRPAFLLHRTPLGPAMHRYEEWWRNVVFEDTGDPYITITR